MSDSKSQTTGGRTCKQMFPEWYVQSAPAKAERDRRIAEVTRAGPRPSPVSPVLNAQTTVELIAESLFEDTRQGHPDCMTWAEMKAHHGPEYEGVARFYSRANAALNALASAGYAILKSHS